MNPSLSTPVADEAPELSILVVSYNTQRETLEALRSLYAYPPKTSFEVILIDNASADGSYEAVVKEFPQVKAIYSKDNLGFAAGNNVASKEARGRLLLLLNPDTITLPHTFDGLLGFVRDEPSRRIWGGRTLFEDHSLNKGSCFNRISLWSVFTSSFGLSTFFPNSNFLNPENFGGWQRDSVRDVDIVCGCFLLIETDLWRELGGFDLTYFMYAEEADLCLRAHSRGAKPGISPKAELIHLGGRSEASRTEKVMKVMKGRLTLMRKHWSPIRFKLGQLIYSGWALSRYLASSIIAGPRDEAGKSHEKWKRIWQERSDWLSGYPELKS